MKAVMLTGAGGTELLKLMDVPDPVIKSPLDVLVRIHACGLNPVDYKLRERAAFTLIVYRSSWVVMGPGLYKQ